MVGNRRVRIHLKGCYR